MYTSTSHSCMFQPQDEIEVGEDGFKQYDGKQGSLKGNLCVFVCNMGALFNALCMLLN